MQRFSCRSAVSLILGFRPALNPLNCCRPLSTSSTCLQESNSSSSSPNSAANSTANGSANGSGNSSANSSANSNPKPWRRQGSASNTVLRSQLRALGEIEKSPTIDEKEEAVIDPVFVKKFTVGSTYDPFDFSIAKLQLDRQERLKARRVSKVKDVKLDESKIWRDPVFLSNFITSNGRIISGAAMGHSGKTQRKIARAIKRCRAAGLISNVHKSIEFLPGQ